MSKIVGNDPVELTKNMSKDILKPDEVEQLLRGCDECIPDSDRELINHEVKECIAFKGKSKDYKWAIVEDMISITKVPSDNNYIVTRLCHSILRTIRNSYKVRLSIYDLNLYKDDSTDETIMVLRIKDEGGLVPAKYYRFDTLSREFVYMKEIY